MAYAYKVTQIGVARGFQRPRGRCPDLGQRIERRGQASRLQRHVTLGTGLRSDGRAHMSGMVAAGSFPKGDPVTDSRCRQTSASWVAVSIQGRSGPESNVGKATARQIIVDQG